MSERKEINYQFRQRFSVVHEPKRRDLNKKSKENQATIDASWCITVPRDSGVVLMNAARDLEDYFMTSMDIPLKLLYDDFCDIPLKRISYVIDPDIDALSYRLEVDENSVLLKAQNEKMLAQAGYFVEDLMNIEEAPYLDYTNITRTSLFNPRMVHSGYGLDMFPTEHLKNIAHAGISALLIFVTDVDKTPHGYQDFNDICYRASQYGLDVYAYSYLQNKLHPDDEGAEKYYDDLYGKLFERCPYFKGIIFVGESFEFPSKDPHTTGLRRQDNKGPDGKPLVTGKYNPGWWPCYDYPDLLNIIKKAIFKRRPDADIVFWSYNWNMAPAKDREALINNLPKDITLQATYEMGQYVERDGIKNRTTDYTLFFTGPGYYFETESQFAKNNGLRLYSMTNTGGLTWDVGVVPYIPAPYQWIKRFNGMIDAHYNVGLVGTMDSHHYGFCPSFISDLAKWAFHSPKCDLEEILRKLVVRDFSEETADDVLQAYKYFSEGIHYLISTQPDQYGPFRCGPAYPFVLYKDVDIKIPTTPYAHFGGNKICFPIYGSTVYSGNYNERDLIPNEAELKKFNYEIESFGKTTEFYDMGTKILESVINNIPERKKDNAKRILGLCRFIANAARTAVNIKEFYKRKHSLLKTEKEERNKLVDEMIAICEREKENAERTIPIVEFDSRIGYEPSMEYMCDASHLLWKIDQIKKVIEEELPSYYDK